MDNEKIVENLNKQLEKLTTKFLEARMLHRNDVEASLQYIKMLEKEIRELRKQLCNKKNSG